MDKILDSKRVKGKTTDKKIAQLLIDVYKNSPFYMAYYNALGGFFDTMQEKGQTSTTPLPESDQKMDMKTMTENLNFWNELFGSIEFTGKDLIDSMTRKTTPIKSVDIQKKYNISHMTVRERLIGSYFDTTYIQEGKKKYVGLLPKDNILMYVVFYRYFKDKDIKQNNLLRNIINLFENMD